MASNGDYEIPLDPELEKLWNAGAYVEVSATWRNKSARKDLNFTVLGPYRHSQYNTPDENKCSGDRTASVPLFTASCRAFNGPFKPIFRDEVLENGSGFSIGFGDVQKEAFCPGRPPGSFRANTQIKGAYGSVNNSTVAFKFDQFIRSDNVGKLDKILIVGVGVKTVTDECPGCALKQFDNYSTVRECRNEKDAARDLGTINTILLK